MALEECIQGTVKGRGKRGKRRGGVGGRCRGWTGVDFASSAGAAGGGSRWKGIVANSSVVPRRPPKVMG